MAAATYINSGTSWKHTPGSAIAAGTPTLLSGGAAGFRLGIPTKDIPANVQGDLVVFGAFMVDKLSTDAMTPGDKLYWDAGNSRLTTTASTHKLVGQCIEAAAATTTQVAIQIPHIGH